MFVSRKLIELKAQGLQRKDYKEVKIAKEGLQRSKDDKGKMNPKLFYKKRF